MDRDLRDLYESYYEIYTEAAEDPSVAAGRKSREELNKNYFGGFQNKPLKQGANWWDRIVHSSGQNFNAFQRGLRGQTVPSTSSGGARLDNQTGRALRSAGGALAGFFGAPSVTDAYGNIRLPDDKAKVGFLTRNGVKGWQGPDGKWSPLPGQSTTQPSKPQPQTQSQQKDDADTAPKQPAATATDSDTSSATTSSAVTAPPATSTTASTPSSTTTSSASTQTSKPSDPQMDANYKTWARAHKDLAAKVKPGQAGYEAIQSVLKQESFAPPTMRDLVDSYYEIYFEQQSGKPAFLGRGKPPVVKPAAITAKPTVKPAPRVVPSGSTNRARPGFLGKPPGTTYIDQDPGRSTNRAKPAFLGRQAAPTPAARPPAPAPAPAPAARPPAPAARPPEPAAPVARPPAPAPVARPEPAAPAASAPAAEKPSENQMDNNYKIWARAHKDLAARVKPGQAGYEAIQSVLKQESFAPPTMRDLVNSYYDIYEKLDPVGEEDDDVDNDGDSDESDRYIKNKRKKIGDAMKKKSKHYHDDDEDEDEDDEMNEETKSERYARLHASEMKGRKKAASREGRVTRAGEDLLRDIMDTNRALRNAQKPMSDVTRSASRSEAPEANRRLPQGMRRDTLASRASRAMREDEELIFVVANFLLENDVVDDENQALEFAMTMDDEWFREVLLTEALNEDF